jgi:hypothetical protein
MRTDVIVLLKPFSDDYIGLIDPVAAGVGAEKHDLQDPAFLGINLMAIAFGEIKLFKQDFLNAGQLALLFFRQVIDICSHEVQRRHGQFFVPSGGYGLQF